MLLSLYTPLMFCIRFLFVIFFVSFAYFGCVRVLWCHIFCCCRHIHSRGITYPHTVGTPSRQFRNGCSFLCCITTVQHVAIVARVEYDMCHYAMRNAVLFSAPPQQNMPPAQSHSQVHSAVMGWSFLCAAVAHAVDVRVTLFSLPQPPPSRP